MNPLERLISVVAPFSSLGCGKEGTILCNICSADLLGTIPSRCYRCHVATSQYAVCANCKRKVALKHVWVATEYAGIIKDLVRVYKFERAKAAHGVIASLLDEFLPLLPPETIVTYVPTTTSRVRQRGYDQSRLIARSLAYKRGLLFDDILLRASNTRQVGSGRKDRFAQLEGAFEIKQISKVNNQRILLVDDVLTTGATLESASKVLSEAGAKVIDAIVFAH